MKKRILIETIASIPIILVFIIVVQSLMYSFITTNDFIAYEKEIFSALYKTENYIASTVRKNDKYKSISVQKNDFGNGDMLSFDIEKDDKKYTTNILMLGNQLISCDISDDEQIEDALNKDYRHISYVDNVTFLLEKNKLSYTIYIDDNEYSYNVYIKTDQL